MEIALRWSFLSTAAVLLFLPVPTAAITVGQVDTFDAGTAGWTEGINSTNMPTTVATGGPQGSGDAYLQNISSGVGLGGSKQNMFNRSQWTGNYESAGVDRIRMQVANFGTSPLNVRVAIRGSNLAWWSTSSAAATPADATWRQVMFTLSAADMTLITGSGSFSEALTDVIEVRILSNPAPSFRGETIAATLGVDHIEAVDSSVSNKVSSWGGVKAVFEAP